MNIEEMRGKDSRELLLDLESLRKEQFTLRFRAVSEEVAKTARFRAIRRTVARIKTVLRQREGEQSQGVGAASAAPAAVTKE